MCKKNREGKKKMEKLREDEGKIGEKQKGEKWAGRMMKKGRQGRKIRGGMKNKEG